MRGAGVVGAADAGGAAGVSGVTRAAGAAIGGSAAGGAATIGGGATARGGATAGGAAGGAGAAGITGAAGLSTTGATAAGFAWTTGATGGTAGFAVGGAATGFVATGGCGTDGRAGAGCGAAPSFCCRMAFSTSPGWEMCERSILVLISSSPRRGRADLAACAGASDKPRKWARTFSASCSSRELECVFFSVTPTSASMSVMALLLTSSSLARSLIRTLLIRPFSTPRCA